MSDNLTDALPAKTDLDPKISEIIDSVLTVQSAREQNDYEVLVKVAYEALNFFPPLYVQSIFGRIGDWMPPHRKDSEYTIIDFWRPARTLGYLIDTMVPAFSHSPGPIARTLLPPVVQNLFWRPSNYFQQADPFDSVTSFTNEQWFFINGIATNEAVAKINSDFITELFQRPITVIHNETSSTLLDLVQCAVGKTFKADPGIDYAQSMTEPAVKATVAILEALKDPHKDRVVLLCHSQGTIITANVLRALQRSLSNIQLLRKTAGVRSQLNLELIDELALDILWKEELFECSSEELDCYLVQTLKKLEVYTFANCADKMNYITYTKNKLGEQIGLPYIENFANQFDLVARLGVLSPLRVTEPNIIEIDGDVYEKQGLDAWGHLLNHHYLFGMQRFLKGQGSNPYQPSQMLDSQRMPTIPRLYEYYEGRRPAAYYE